MNLHEQCYYVKLDGKTVATVSHVRSETPWMSGKVAFVDSALFDKLIAVSAMAGFDLDVDALDVDEAEEERLWAAKMHELALTWDDLKLPHNGRWTMSDNDHGEYPIYSPLFHASGWMDWRQ